MQAKAGNVYFTDHADQEKFEKIIDTEGILDAISNWANFRKLS